MKEITGKPGLVGNFTYHSGKRTCATQLYQAGVDEQEIMSRTGHRSETAVRKYKRSNSVLMENVSKVLDPPKMMKFEDPLTPVIIQDNLLMNDSKEVQNQENIPLNPQSVFNNF